MINRLKQLRKVLNLSQAKFAEKIGLRQGTLGDIETGKSNLTDRNFNAICREFNVNPEWLRNGVGEMFNPPASKNFLEKLAEEKGLDARGKALIQSIIDLPASVREGVIDWALNLARELNAQNSTSLEDEVQKLRAENTNLKKRIVEITQGKFFQDGRNDEELTLDEAQNLIAEQFDSSGKRKMFTASTSTSGQVKKNSS